MFANVSSFWSLWDADIESCVSLDECACDDVVGDCHTCVNTPEGRVYQETCNITLEECKSQVGTHVVTLYYDVKLIYNSFITSSKLIRHIKIVHIFSYFRDNVCVSLSPMMVNAASAVMTHIAWMMTITCALLVLNNTVHLMQ